MNHAMSCPAGFQITEQTPTSLRADDRSDPSQQPVQSLGMGSGRILKLPAADPESDDEDLNHEFSDNPCAENPDHFDLYDAFTLFERRGGRVRDDSEWDECGDEQANPSTHPFSGGENP